MTTFYCLRFETPATWRARSPYLYPIGTGLCPRHLVPFPSSFTTHRTTVEVIRTRLHNMESQSAMPWRINSRRTEYKTPPPTVSPLFALVFVAAQARTGRVEFHVTTDGQSASPPRNNAPVWSPRPYFRHCQTVEGPPICPPPPREDESAAYNRCRTSPAQSVSDPSPAGPATTLHRLRFETSPYVASHDSQGNGGGTRHRLHMGLVISITFFKL
jgi:hypothetical protein